MIHTTHLLFAILLTLLFGKLLHIPVLSSESILFVFLGSLLPDIDHPHSYINRKSWKILFLSGITSGHRGWTHSFLGVVAFTILFHFVTLKYHLNITYTYLFFFGYLSHLISDSLNPSGIAWFWPKKKKYGIDLIKTGSFEETLFQFALIASIFLCAYSS